MKCIHANVYLVLISLAVLTNIVSIKQTARVSKIVHRLLICRKMLSVYDELNILRKDLFV